MMVVLFRLSITNLEDTATFVEREVKKSDDTEGSSAIDLEGVGSERPLV